MWFPNRSDTNQPVQSLKQARSLKEEELFYLCSENHGADQLRSHCEADLCLCFRIFKMFFFFFFSHDTIHFFTEDVIS